MDFLEIWKTFPVLCHNCPTPTDTFYMAAVTELTNHLNSKINLTLTNAGMILTLRRIRQWFRRYKANDKISADGKNINHQEYYEKCSEFLSKRETRTVSCNICKRYFTDEKHLEEHKATLHKKYCDICQRDFGHYLAYRKHAVVHGPPMYKCHICNKEYHRSGNYQEHLRAHRNELNYVCDQCGRRFVRQKNLREHTLQKHSNKDNPTDSRRKILCAICDIEFSCWSALSLHRRKHHMVLEGTNEQLQFKRPIKHTKHTYTLDPVTKERRLTCTFCDNTYSHHGGLYRHIKKQHGRFRSGES